MKISESNISMLSTRSYVEHTEIKEQLRVWIGNKRPDFENIDDAGNSKASVWRRHGLDSLELSNRGKEIATTKSPKNADDMFKLEGKEKLKAQILERFIESLTGKKVKIELLDDEDFEKCDTDPNCKTGGEVANPNNNVQNQPERQGWGVEYDYHESHYESESTSFSAMGTVRTADGKEIDFSVDVSMSREFMEEHNISIRAGDARKIDPLVIDFSGASTELTQTKFSFDLNSDGVSENISMLNPNSGFLALDKNNDGIINDGSELFGPSTGQGFDELSAYDEDGNMWIDENDSIFKALLTW
ncbi:MAG: hypothetical protein HY779_04665, partial [Rubrobacteridae bacterium]|nr:hypothetical protein [Rubrobacteridae bacterium]